MADFIVKGKVSLDTGDFVGSARRASDSLNGLNTSVGSTSKSMKYLKRSALAAGVALGGLAMAGVKAASDYQQSMIAFTKMMGSAEKATTFVKELQEFAAKTPFELPQVQAGAKKLMAFGFEASQVLPMLTSIGNAASGLSLGSEGIDRLTLAIGQMQAKGKVSGGELRQLAEAGIPALQYLADALGKTQAEILDMSEKGAIPASVGVGILIKGMEEGSKNAMGFSGMMEAQSKTMSGLMSTLKDTVRNAFVDGFNKYVPAISGSFEKMIGKVGPMMEKFIAFMGYMVGQIGKILGGIAVIIKPIFENFLLPAFKIVGSAVLILIAALAKFGEFLKKNAGAVEFIVNVLAVGALAYGAYRAQVVLTNIVTALFTKTMKLKAKVIAVATRAQLLLNAAMRMNPIGLVVSAITLLIAGLITAWNNSDAFRKIMIQVGKAGVMGIGYIIKIVGVLLQGLLLVTTGPLRLLLKGLELLGVDAAGKALDGIGKMTKGIGNFFDKTGNQVQDFADKLDGLANKKFKLPSFGIPKKGTDGKPAAGPAISADTFDFNLEDALKNAGMDGDLGKGTKAVQKDMINVVKGFRDFIANDFTPGFMEGSDQARDTILKGLDEAKKVFDEFSKGMKGDELKNVENAYNALDDKIRAMIPQAMGVAAELEAVRDEIDKAKQALEKAIESRAEGAAAFVNMLAEPFGEPSQLNTALSSAEASVSSIMGMYEQIVEAVNKRYEGIDPTGRNALLTALEAQTQQLINLVKERDIVVKELEDAQEALKDAINLRTQGAGSISQLISSSFGQPMEISEALSDAKATSDSIISMHERLVSAIESRYAGIDPAGKNELVNFLKNETQQLLDLTAQRNKIASDLEKAKQALGEAASQRQSGADSLTSLLRKSFGQSSDLENALNDGKATADSIIKMFETISKAIEARYSGIDQKGKSALLSALENQTNNLLSLVKKRDAATKALEEAQKYLESVLAKQLEMKSSVSSSLKSFATSLTELSSGSAQTTLKVIKTATGLVITQMKDGSQGVDKVTKQLQSRLHDIREFSQNIKKLLASGLNKDYVQQLLTAGPEAAGATAALLASTGQEQIVLINELYSTINEESVAFGNQMADTFYGNSVLMGQAMVDGAASEYGNIISEMTRIKDGIAESLSPLSLLGTNLGLDLAQGLVDSLVFKHALVISQMEIIRDAIIEKLKPLSTLGTKLGKDLAEGLVDKLKEKHAAIIAQMKQINEDIASSLAPLSKLGTSLGTDLAQGLLDALKAKEEALVALAKSIADKIAAAMAAAMASVGAMNKSLAEAYATSAEASAAAAKAAAAASAAATNAAAATAKAVADAVAAAQAAADAAANAIIAKAKTSKDEKEEAAAAAAAAAAAVIAGLTINPSVLASQESGAIGAASIAAQIAAASAANAPKVGTGYGISDSQNTARLIAEAAAKAAASSTVVEKGAVTVTIGSNIPADDVEGIMTRSLLNALRTR